MTALAPEVWNRLATEHVQGETLRARRAAPDISDRLIAALDSRGERHLLVRLNPAETDLRDAQSRGIEVFTRELAVPGHQPGRFIDVACHDAAGHDAFDLIGGELAQRLTTGKETAPEVVSRVLSKWRRFWGQVPKSVLSREERLGLFAELWFLNYWLLPRVGAAEALARWRGAGARHDFEWAGQSVEAKATTSTRGHIHWVNGVEQLLPPDSGQLKLFSLRLREEAGGAHSLPDLIAECRAFLEKSPHELGLFEDGLARYGYSPLHEDEYRSPLRVIEQALYAVEGDFPRIVPSAFQAGVPSGVERVEYEINLGGAGHHCVAREPNEAKSL